MGSKLQLKLAPAHVRLFSSLPEPSTYREVVLELQIRVIDCKLQTGMLAGLCAFQLLALFIIFKAALVRENYERVLQTKHGSK